MAPSKLLADENRGRKEEAAHGARLVFDLTRHAGRRTSGVPLGFFLAHVEFTDILYVLNPALWKSTLPRCRHEKRSRWCARPLVALAVALILLTTLVNLMGPATAVLLIPRLGWVDVKTKTAVQIFVGADLENRPHGDMTLEGCDALALDVGNFSCTQGAYSTGFEQLVETAIQSGLTDSVDLDNYLYYDSALYQDYGLIQEGPLKALANYSMTGPAALFVPHRQVLRNLSEDIREQLEGAEIDDGIGEKAPRTQRALDLLVQREGPSFGFDWVCGISNVTLIDISAERTVACFSNWTYNDTSRVYNKCYGMGGFNANPKVSSFYLGNQTGNQLMASVFLSDKAVYFDETTDFGSGVHSCLNNKAQECDWDRIFAASAKLADLDDQILFDLSQKLLVTTYSPVNTPSTSSPGLQDNTAVVFCDHTFRLGFPTYGTRLYFGDNPALVASFTDRVRSADSSVLSVDPDWFLATWSVDSNGTLNTAISQKILDQVLQSSNGTLSASNRTFSENAVYDLEAVNNNAIMQMLSLAPVSFVNATSANSQKGSENQDQTRTANRILHRWASRYVWAYGCDSRSSQFALTVAIAGCLVALIQISFQCLSPQHYRHDPLPPTATLVAALRHKCQEQELDVQSREDGTKAKGTLRWRIPRLQSAMRTLWSNEEDLVLRKRYNIRSGDQGEQFEPV